MVAAILAPLSAKGAAEGPGWRASDREYRLVLTVPETGEDQAESERTVFFVDFKEAGQIKRNPNLPDVNTCQLYARKGGEPIPFSLDYRLYVRGSGLKKNVSEEQLCRLGFLSFIPVPGETEYHLYFNLGSAETLKEKTDKNIRPWWIEAVVDPCFEIDKNNDGKPDLCAFWAKENSDKFWKIMSQPGQPEKKYLEISHPAGGTVRSRPGLCQFDRRSAGHRVIFYQQIQIDPTGAEFKGSLVLPLPDFQHSSYRPAVSIWVGGIPAGEWNELCAEGRVSPLFDGLAPDKISSFWYAGPCRIRETHVQFPPERPDANRIDIDTDVACQTDDIALFWKSQNNDIFLDVPVVLEEKTGKRREIRGERVEDWREGFVLEARLISGKSGEIVAKVESTAARGEQWRGTMSFRNLASGKYLLRFEAKSRRKTAETAAILEKNIRIISNPFE